MSVDSTNPCHGWATSRIEPLEPGAALDEDEDVRPLYESTPLRDLAALVINGVLYATRSADVRAGGPAEEGRTSECTHTVGHVRKAVEEVPIAKRQLCALAVLPAGTLASVSDHP